MSRYRAVFCQIWSDDKFPFLADDAKLVWFHIYTCEQSTAVGIFKASIEGLAADIRWDPKRYRKGFGECLEEGFVEYDERLHVVRFPKFFRWNRPANPNVMRGWISSWKNVPKSELKARQFKALEDAAIGWGEGFANVLETFRETLPQTIPKQEQEQEQEQEVKPARAKSSPKPVKQLEKPDWIDDQTWSDLLSHRKKIGAPLTSTAWKAIERQLQDGIKAGHDSDEMLSEWLSAGWRGFRLDWYEARIQKDPPGGQKKAGRKLEEWT